MYDLGTIGWFLHHLQNLENFYAFGFVGLFFRDWDLGDYYQVWHNTSLSFVLRGCVLLWFCLHPLWIWLKSIWKTETTTSDKSEEKVVFKHEAGKMNKTPSQDNILFCWFKNRMQNTFSIYDSFFHMYRFFISETFHINI